MFDGLALRAINAFGIERRSIVKVIIFNGLGHIFHARMVADMALKLFGSHQRLRNLFCHEREALPG